MNVDELVKQVNEAFETLYAILRQDGYDPEEHEYSIVSVQADIQNILTGKLNVPVMGQMALPTP